MPVFVWTAGGASGEFLDDHACRVSADAQEKIVTDSGHRPLDTRPPPGHRGLSDLRLRQLIPEQGRKA